MSRDPAAHANLSSKDDIADLVHALREAGGADAARRLAIRAADDELDF